jgi:hypothetical protein
LTGDEDIDGHCDPDLGLYCVLGCAEECLGSQLLFDPTVLPSRSIERIAADETQTSLILMHTFTLLSVRALRLFSLRPCVPSFPFLLEMRNEK